MMFYQKYIQKMSKGTMLVTVANHSGFVLFNHLFTSSHRWSFTDARCSNKRPVGSHLFALIRRGL